MNIRILPLSLRTARRCCAPAVLLLLLTCTVFAADDTANQSHAAKSAPATAAAPAIVKRPLRHSDYDGWRSILSPSISPDGRFVVYGLYPEEGDGEVVVRDLQSGKEYRQSAGQRPAPPKPNYASAEEEPPQQPKVTVTFTADNQWVAFSTFPAKADVDKAKRAKKGDEPPRGGMVIVNLLTGAATRYERIKSFQTAEEVTAAGPFVVFLREPEKRAATASDDGNPPAPSREKKKQYGGELVFHNLRSGEELKFADVTEFQVAKDGSGFAYAVASRDESKNGVYALFAEMAHVPAAVISGPGRYLKLAFDEQQKQLAFLSDRDEAGSKRPRLKLYLWQRGTPEARALASADTPGMKSGYLISDKGSITFSRDGQHVFFGCAPAPVETDLNIPDADKVSMDLWHWKDDYIQPMQKVRAEMERSRSYRAVYHVSENKLVQLADESMPEITPSDDGLWAIGSDDRDYRRMVEYDTRYADAYLVNTLTGERKLLVKKVEGRVTWSPGGKYALYFDGKDWVTLSVPEATHTVLTTKAGVNFYREDIDTPSVPPPYGNAGWTKDGKYVLLYDKFDVWRVTPDGAEAVNLTGGAGRKTNVAFRYVKLDKDAKDPDAKWIDSAAPLLLRGENEDTRDTGFYRVSINGGEPQKLILQPRSFSTPVKAKHADVMLVTASRFDEFPDLQVTDSSFKSLKKISDANPQRKELLWGTAELIRFRNTDGVPLQATLYKPENFDPHKKYPMLVYIYEKLSQNVNQFVDPKPGHSINVTYYVSNGYLVLEPDIVYTIGYPGQSALKCVLPAIDTVSAMGFVDEKNIGIQGHSWGGYQIAYMVTQTNRFKAAEAGAPVSDMISAYDGIRWGPGLPRQFQYEHTQSRIGGTLWEEPMRYIANSPIFQADRVDTPLMILANDADDAVPWYQGIEYFLALRRLGKEVYMFTYNGEPHHLDRRPNQKDYTVRMQQFFDHFLKGAPAPEWMKTGVPYLQRDAEKERMKDETGVY